VPPFLEWFLLPSFSNNFFATKGASAPAPPKDVLGANKQQQQQQPQTPIDLSVLPASLPAQHRSALVFEGVSGRAAANLFIYGGIEGKRDEIASEMKSILNELKDSKSPLSLSFKIPDRQDFNQAIKQYLAPASPYKRALFEYLLESKAFEEKILLFSAQRYLAMMKDLKGDLDGQFVTPKPVSPKMLADWKKVIEKNYLKPGQSIKLTNIVDESVVHGYRLIIGNKIYDNSISTLLESALDQKDRTQQGRSILRKDALKRLRQEVPPAFYH